MKTIDFEVTYFQKSAINKDWIKKTRMGVMANIDTINHMAIRSKIGSMLCDLILQEEPGVYQVNIDSIKFKLEEQ